MFKNLVEVFTAGCPLCDETVKLVKNLACFSCEVKIYDFRQEYATNKCLEKKVQSALDIFSK